MMGQRGIWRAAANSLTLCRLGGPARLLPSCGVSEVAGDYCKMSAGKQRLSD
jgi:hypothetical protein